MDPVADMLTQIRNAQAVRKGEVDVPFSKFKKALADVLCQEGYLESVRVFKPKGGSFKRINLVLKYFEGSPFIAHLRRISSPGQRLYVGQDELPRVLSGSGLVIVSTSRGVMSAEEARKRGLGGELICEVW